MPAQNFANHARFVPLYHFVLTGLVLLTLIGSVVNLVSSIRTGEGLYSASLIVAVVVALILAGFYARAFALGAQDRAIRAEENLRHFILFSRPLDARLTLRQIIGLRFASDEEFELLAGRAVDENLSEKEIKKAVKNWRGDFNRI